METLVVCPCGHALDQHGDRGCAGDGDTTCACLRTRFEAVDAAVDAERIESRAAREPQHGEA